MGEFTLRQSHLRVLMAPALLLCLCACEPPKPKTISKERACEIERKKNQSLLQSRVSAEPGDESGQSPLPPELAAQNPAQRAPKAKVSLRPAASRHIPLQGPLGMFAARKGDNPNTIAKHKLDEPVGTPVVEGVVSPFRGVPGKDGVLFELDSSATPENTPPQLQVRVRVTDGCGMQAFADFVLVPDFSPPEARQASGPQTVEGGGFGQPTGEAGSGLAFVTSGGPQGETASVPPAHLDPL